MKRETTAATITKPLDKVIQIDEAQVRGRRDSTRSRSVAWRC